MDEEMGNCYAVRINSGRFGVEWQKTKAVLEAGELDITIFRPEEEEEADRASTAAGGKLGRLPTKGEKAPVGINARTCNPWASGRAKAQGPFGKQLRGVKRKAERDLDGDDDPDGEDMEETERVQSHSEIAKRREKLGLQS